MVSSVALLVCHVVMRNRKTMVLGRGGKQFWYFFANVLMRLCGFISGLLCFLQFIVCGSWCLYAFVELRISSVFFFVGTIVLRYVLLYVLFISLVFFGAIHVRCVSEMRFRWLLDL